MLKIFSYIITFLAGIWVGKSLKRKRVKIKYFDATSMVDKRRSKG